MTPHRAGNTHAHLPGTADGHWPAQASPDALGDEASMRGATGFAACALMADGQAAGEGRRFTWSTLSGWGLNPLIDNATLIVSELLSNALQYGLVHPPAHRADRRPVWLGLLRRGRTVLCTVCDHSTAVPVLRKPDHLSQSGRGLHIVNYLSASWGWTTPNVGGKAVWAAVSPPSRDDAPASAATTRTW
ncbi:ATP-binding protein [Streptomyces sp. SID7805]|nr:ATP-binding protein [Streptomyces sp. SID7805]